MLHRYLLTAVFPDTSTEAEEKAMQYTTHAGRFMLCEEKQRGRYDINFCAVQDQKFEDVLTVPCGPLDGS